MAASRFVVQLHDATALHFDLRIQAGEVLRSWAVPKGPSLDPGVRRLAVPVADHDLSAGDFEGVHEGQPRGSGAVIIWDEGGADIVRDEPGHLSFTLHGHKLSGGFGLTRTGENRWILVKVRDEHARAGSDIVAEQPASVRSGRTWQQLAAGRPPTAGPDQPGTRASRFWRVARHPLRMNQPSRIQVARATPTARPVAVNSAEPASSLRPSAARRQPVTTCGSPARTGPSWRAANRPST